MHRGRKASCAVFSAVALAALLQGSALAQGEDLLELLRSDLKTEKVALLTEAMEFSSQQAEVFWPIYREYDLELSKLGDSRIALIKDYAANYESMTDAKAKELVQKTFKLEGEVLKLQEKYYQKVEKALSSTEAARFIQVERQIRLLLDVQIAAQIPLVKKSM